MQKNVLQKSIIIALLALLLAFLLWGAVAFLLLLFLALVCITIIVIFRTFKADTADKSQTIKDFPPSPVPPDIDGFSAPPSLAYIDAMDSHDFELFVADLLRNAGFIQVEVTRGGGDYGCDIVAHKDLYRFVFQCKCYDSNVGMSAVQEITGALAHYAANKAIIITNAYYTENAKSLALSNNITLWSRNELQQLMQGTLPPIGQIYTHNGALAPLYLSSIPGLDFCYDIAEILQKNGYVEIAVTKGVNSHGADIFAERYDNSYVFACIGEDSTVDLGIIEDVQEAMVHYQANRGIIVKDGSFSKREADFSRTPNIALWDKEYLDTLRQ